MTSHLHTTPISARAPRAFTLIEVILATMLGTLVIAGAASVIGMLNRSDTMLRDRFDQTHDLAKSQIVFRRIFSTVVMSNEQKPVGYATTGTRAMSEQARAAAAARAAEGLNLPTPRFILTQDERWSAGSGGMSLNPGETFTPQRLEIVVSQPPLVSSLAPREVLENRDAATVVRGALEVRPSRTRAGKSCWALWWVPLIETEEGWTPMRDDNGITLGDKITDGLSGVRYTIFDDRQRKSVYSSIWYDELPAYVEIEVRTVAGLYGNWMFDIGWFIGPDSPASTLPEEQQNAPAAVGVGGGGGGGGGGEGGAGRGPGGQRPGAGRGPGGGRGPGRQGPTIQNPGGQRPGGQNPGGQRPGGQNPGQGNQPPGGVTPPRPGGGL